MAFDIYIAVDWSAKNTPSSKKPSADALWLALIDPSVGRQEEHYFRTREQCCEFIEACFDEALAQRKRVLIGYDFDFGFPHGLSEAMGNTNKLPWRYHWAFLSEHIRDGADNSNNRFEVAAKINELVGGGEDIGPFWGHPVKAEFSWLRPKSPAYPYVAKNKIELSKKRYCEQRESKAQPVWKLIGTASVGGQSLVGIARLKKLRFRDRFEQVSRIWPFETGFGSDILQDFGVNIVHVEIWPGLLGAELDPGIEIRDQAQVKATAEWFAKLDRNHELPWLMTPPHWLTKDDILNIEREEGWVIGAGLDGRLYPSAPSGRSSDQGDLFD